ncbi:hypothetical protein H6P81_005725 [Aristolochia fimbriata]|uniref:EF-hand domain-containing protein n=1 Tax=Aristolochia fimbriata TaxID=158543 RepID=A0AAV7EZ01_ARIFI|nr:hypothetical protein H6P81_005725 [Aristolochia fimbriata]
MGTFRKPAAEGPPLQLRGKREGCGTKSQEITTATSPEALSSVPSQEVISFVFNMDQPYAMLDFEDFLPSMAQQLGEEGFMIELRNGFHLLMDRRTGLITFESLKTNCALLGLHGLGDDEVLSMLREGDLDGDGALNQMEFYILMFTLSPGLMEGARKWLENRLLKEA